MVFEPTVPRNDEDKSKEELVRDLKRLCAVNDHYIKTIEDLCHTEVRFKSLIQNSTDIIRILDPEGRIIYDSPSSEKILGYPAGYTLGKTPFDFIHPDDLRRVRNDLGEVKDRRNAGVPTEFRIRKADGTYLWVESTGVNMMGVPGVDGIVITTRSIAERRKSEEMSSRLSLIVESSDDAIISKSLDGVITSWNVGAERMFCYKADEVIGKNVSILIPPGYTNEIPGMLNKIKHGERIDHYETIRMKKDGTLINVSVTVSPIKDKSGMVIGASSIKRDITEKKQMEKELQEKQEELEIQAEELEVQNEELLSNNIELKEAKMQSELYLDLMGHDISNMHQIAISQLELAQEIMAEDGKLEGEEQELIDTPLQTLERSAKLIDNVRKLQMLKIGEYKLEIIDLGALIADVVEEYSKIQGTKITINYVNANGFYVKANPLLSDVFINLVDNAIKHSNGLATINIGMSKAVSNGSLFYQVAVEDNGPGILGDKKEEVFHRLNRGQTTARGTGLGLYIVKTLVESFQGRVTVEDRVPCDYKKGSRFVVMLPAVEK